MISVVIIKPLKSQDSCTGSPYPLVGRHALVTATIYQDIVQLRCLIPTLMQTVDWDVKHQYKHSNTGLHLLKRYQYSYRPLYFVTDASVAEWFLGKHVSSDLSRA